MSLPITRRRALATVTTAIGSAIAGCGEPVARDSDGEWPAVDDPGETTDFEAFELRIDPFRQFVFLGDETGDYRELGTFLITADDVSNLHIESVDRDHAAAARSFVEETDFDRESVLVEHRPVTDEGRIITSLTIERGRIELEYCDKSPHQPNWMQALFLRVPHPYPKKPRFTTRGTTCTDGEDDGVTPQRP